VFKAFYIGRRNKNKKIIGIEMADLTFQDYYPPTVAQTQKQKIIRFTFCAYWLYFFGFRGVFESRLLDYLGISLTIIGVILLFSTNRWVIKTMWWVAIFISPLFLAVILNPNVDATIFCLNRIRLPCFCFVF